MRLTKSLKLALNILLHSKIRSWLTILGIVIGVAAIVAIVSIGEGAQASVNARLSGLGADLITVSPGFDRAGGGFRMMDDHGGGTRGVSGITTIQKNLTEKDVQLIKSVEGVSFVNGIISGRADVYYLAQTSSINIQGVDPLAWRNIVTTELDSGRYLNPGDANVAVIGNRVSATMFKQPIGVNRDITISGKVFKVVGVLKATGSGGGDDSRIYMPITQARTVIDKYAGTDKFDSITVKVDNIDNVDRVTSDIDYKLMLFRHVSNKTKDYSVVSAKAIQAQVQSVTQTFTIFLGAIAAVSLLVGAVGIANTMFTSVLEKTKEIGIMKAIGAKNYDILMIFLLNSALVGLVGGLIGISLGWGISVALPNLLTSIGPGISIKSVMPISLLIEAILISVIIGMVAGVIPAYRASKLKPVDALRYE